MTLSNEALTRFTDAAAAAVAREIAGLRREAQRERELREAQFAARMADLDARVVAATDAERRLSERIAALQEVEAATAADIAAMVDDRVTRAVAALPPAEPGKSVTLADVEPLITETVSRAVAAIPPVEAKQVDPEVVRQMVQAAVDAIPAPQAGKDADPAETARMVAEAVRAAVEALPAPEKGDPGPMGKLPVVRAWEDRVYYEGEVVSFDGAVYQADRDTGKSPDQADWTCIVAKARDGADGKSFTIRGTWSEGGDYSFLDIVALNGASFAAKRDNPGPCPGEGWQMIAAQGKPGKPGEPGKPGVGLRGDPGPAVVSIEFDDSGVLRLVHGDGTTVDCDLYPVLSRLG